MSDTVIKFIPANPRFVPKKEAINEAELWIRSLTSCCEIKSILTDEIRFIDQGENFQSIICPLCLDEISLDWWSDAMEKASENHFDNLSVIVPCCYRETSLNNLQYHWNAGFARFSIEIMNPTNEEVTRNIKTLENILSCFVKKVDAYY
ncbi:hypothetical protein [Pontibacillus sp. HMF3514]|uniref:hypothetical protein n=1 Tax=Pontibacillus sp. HMF3514 TaxID=2692425 RepID=UPI00131F65E4|nr:hypothetical protein [Pontibacillus sp. HMF3514]QHE52819.1 hypothetical protein GS400_12650 [Pontibacillus sp. HMF3514]